MQLGRLGVWYPVDRLSAQQLRDLVVRVERLGYDALWYPESRGYESFSVAGYMLGCSQKLKLGSSIASIYARDAFTAARGADDAQCHVWGAFRPWPGRKPRADGREDSRAHVQKPVPQMREYLQGVHRAADADIPLAIAALGPLMLKLAAEATHGALPYNTTPEHTRKARAILGPDKWLAVEQKVCLETNAVQAARSAARSSSVTCASTTTATTGCASVSPNRIWPKAEVTASSTRWCCGAIRRPFRRACARISMPERRMCASSRCMKKAT